MATPQRHHRSRGWSQQLSVLVMNILRLVSREENVHQMETVDIIKNNCLLLLRSISFYI